MPPQKAMMALCGKLWWLDLFLSLTLRYIFRFQLSSLTLSNALLEHPTLEIGDIITIDLHQKPYFHISITQSSLKTGMCLCLYVTNICWKRDFQRENNSFNLFFSLERKELMQWLTKVINIPALYAGEPFEDIRLHHAAKLENYDMNLSSKPPPTINIFATLYSDVLIVSLFKFILSLYSICQRIIPKDWLNQI